MRGWTVTTRPLKAEIRGTSNRNVPLDCFNRYVADSPAQFCFFLRDSSNLIAWGNFKAAKTIVTLVPPRAVPTAADPGCPRASWRSRQSISG